MANALREEVAAAERRLEEERSSHASARHRSVAGLRSYWAPLQICTQLLATCVHHTPLSSTVHA